MHRFLLFAFLLGAATSARASDLVVDLHGIRNGGGPLHVKVQTRAEFMGDAAIARATLATPAAGSRLFTFALPPGDYAVSVWHDDNGNGRFDKSESHMPLDGWALSNAAALRGEPTFDAVRFSLGAAPAMLRLDMVYARPAPAAQGEDE